MEAQTSPSKNYLNTDTYRQGSVPVVSNFTHLQTSSGPQIRLKTTVLANSFCLYLQRCKHQSLFLAERKTRLWEC